MTPNATGQPGKSGQDPKAIIADIADVRWREQVEAICKLYAETLAATGDHKAAKKAVDPLKKKLPGIMFAGTFKQRGNAHLETYSRLFCADLDHLEPAAIEAAFSKAKSDPHVVAAFLSPTRTGLKIVFRVAGTAAEHDNVTFRAVRQHVADHYGHAIDESCKNLERLCFVSYDPQAFWKDGAEPLPPIVELGQPAPGYGCAPVEIDARYRIATKLLGPIKRTTGDRFYCPCPGQHLHASGNKTRDCEIYLDGTPTIHCFHESCAGICAALNRELRSLISKAERSVPRGRTGVVLEPPATYSPPPLTLLPPVLRDYVRATARSFGADTAFILLPLLSALAAAIGNSRNLRVKQGFVVPAILWTTVVARSGSKKSPTLSTATTFFVERERELMRLNANASAVHAKELQEWDATPKKERGDEPKRPPCMTCMLDDLTLAIIAPILSDNPRGVLVVKDELASWFGSFGQFNKTSGGVAADVSGWLQLYNGERLFVDRKTNRESHRVIHPRLSISGCIPPSVLNVALTKDFFQRGLPARFLFAAPPPRPNVWTDAEVPAALETAANSILKQLFALRADEHEDGQVPKELSIAPEGLEVFKTFYNRVGQRAVESAENEEAAWSKLTGGAARLALVGHLAHGLDGQPVSGPIMEAAVELASWFGCEAERIYAIFHEPPEADLCRRLVAFIERHGAPVTARQIADSFRPLKNQPEEIERHLNGLVETQRGEWLPCTASEKGGRPTRRFRLFSEPPDCPCPVNPDVAVESDGFPDTDTPKGVDSPTPEADPEFPQADLL
jgi:hypothetical protein